MMHDVILIGTNAFELYVVYRFMYVFFEETYRDRNLVILAYFLRFTVGNWLGIRGSYPFVNLITSTVTLFLLVNCYSNAFLKNIVVVSIIQICMLIAEVFVAILIDHSSFSVTGKVEEINSSFSIVIEFILWGATIILGWFKNLHQKFYVPKRMAMAVVAVTGFSFYMVIIVLEQDSIGRMIRYSSIICVLLLNFIMVFLYDSLAGLYLEKMRIELSEREKQYYHNQTELLQKNHEELRKFRHDEKNKILVIRQMLEQRDYKKAIQYLSEIDDKLEDSRMYSNTGNIVFDSIVNYKLGIAQRNEIDIITDIVIPSKINIDDDDLVIILSNLLDNAIEASQRLEDNKFIELKAKCDRNTLVIQIANRYDSIIKERNGKYETRKDNKTIHGIGISSVQSAIDKNNGVLELKQRDNIFIAKVLLYM